ncbi:MAG: helix-turn-helix transcriptional regulator [Clostridiales bacterium]|jgi:transcriptional regulator with XRE-family HTH domain|nr:helix-turn-helix transcriptional regulator [Clostridiales bacterium]
MFEDLFYKRLTQLRMEKGVSARDMSLSIGQSPSYINGLENRHSLPAMDSFFNICDYFHITPKEFFNDGVEAPTKLQEALKALEPLSAEQLSHIIAIAKDMKR